MYHEFYITVAKLVHVDLLLSLCGHCPDLAWLSYILFTIDFSLFAMSQMKVHVRLGNSPSQTPYTALASLKLLRKLNGVESVRVMICSPWSLDMTQLNGTLRYVGDDCLMNPGKNMRPVCATRYPYYPRSHRFHHHRHGHSDYPYYPRSHPFHHHRHGPSEVYIRRRFLNSQPRDVDPLTLQIVMEFQCVATVLADVLAYVQETVQSYALQPVQCISLRCRKTLIWRWHCLVECVETWSSYIYAPLRCVYNYNAIDIVIYDKQSCKEEQHLMTIVLGLQSMFPDTAVRCILKFCVGPWFPRVPVLDAIVMFTSFFSSEAWRGQWTYFHQNALSFTHPKWYRTLTGIHIREAMEKYPKQILKKALCGETVCHYCLLLWFGWTGKHCGKHIQVKDDEFFLP